jgi:hypothetical protein
MFDEFTYKNVVRLKSLLGWYTAQPEDVQKRIRAELRNWFCPPTDPRSYFALWVHHHPESTEKWIETLSREVEQL